MIPEDVFVIDSVAHAYNLEESNYRVERFAPQVTQMVYDAFMPEAPEELTLTEEQYLRDWGIEEAATMLFLESQTDIATFHPTEITVYKDGLNADAKAKEAIERWPQRFMTMVAIDPLEGEKAIEKLERQAAELDPVGVKLYPSSWSIDGDHDAWYMSDENVAYPVYEKAAELGIDLVSVHKSLPLGSVPMEYYRHGDVEAAATNFPELNFSLVHGGMVFTEEVAWQIARYDNIYVNLETFVLLAHTRPKHFERVFAGLFEAGGAGVVDQLYWGTGCAAYPAQPQLEAFWEFEFDEDWGGKGMFDVPEMTRDTKEKILGKNYARMLGLDIDELKAGIEDDEFSRKRGETLAEPYSTTEIAG